MQPAVGFDVDLPSIMRTHVQACIQQSCRDMMFSLSVTSHTV